MFSILTCLWGYFNIFYSNSDLSPDLHPTASPIKKTKKEQRFQTRLPPKKWRKLAKFEFFNIPKPKTERERKMLFGERVEKIIRNNLMD